MSDTSLFAPAVSETSIEESGGVFTISSQATLLSGGAITWSGTASVSDLSAPSTSLSWTGLSGTMAQGLAQEGAVTSFTDPALAALDAPQDWSGLAILGTDSGDGAADSIAYDFAKPVAAGTSFLLWDPGADFGAGGSETFTVSATLDGAAVSTAGWAFQVVGADSATPSGSYQLDAATGQITVDYSDGGTLPEAVVIITPDNALDALSVTADTIMFDTWGLDVESATCFLPGTRLATPGGPVAVEALRIGDLLCTRGAGAQPVRWIGRRDYAGRFIAGRHLLLPVCIRRGALAEGVPAADLLVSPGHGIVFGQRLVPAWRLVNGVSVTQAAQVERVSYLHVELPSHEVIFAEGCAVESFLDDGCRGQFANAASYAALYPDAAPMRAGLRRLEKGAGLWRVQQKVAARAGLARAAGLGPLRGYVDGLRAGYVAGWAQDEADPEAPVWLHVLAGTRVVARILANGYRADLRAAGLGSGCHGFAQRLRGAGEGALRVVRAADGAALPLTAEALAARAA